MWHTVLLRPITITMEAVEVWFRRMLTYECVCVCVCVCFKVHLRGSDCGKHSHLPREHHWCWELLPSGW